MKTSKARRPRRSYFGRQRHGGKREPRGSSDPPGEKALKGRTPWTDRGETTPGRSGAEKKASWGSGNPEDAGAWRRGCRTRAVPVRSRRRGRNPPRGRRGRGAAALKRWKTLQGARILQEDVVRMNSPGHTVRGEDLRVQGRAGHAASCPTEPDVSSAMKSDVTRGRREMEKPSSPYPRAARTPRGSVLP